MEAKKVEIRISRSQKFFIDVYEKTFNIQGFPPKLVGEPLIINGILCRPYEKILPPEYDVNEIINISMPEQIWSNFHDFFRINNVLYKAVERVERRREIIEELPLEALTEIEDPAVALELRRELEELKRENQMLKQKKEDAEKKLYEAVEEEIRLQKRIIELEEELKKEKQCFSAVREYLQALQNLWANTVEEIEITLPRLNQKTEPLN